MIYLILKLGVIFIIASLTLLTFNKYLYYLKLKKRYGVNTSKKIFLDNLHIPGLIPEKGDEKYQKIQALLLNTGNKTSVQMFFVYRYLIVLIMAIGAMLVINTNTKLDIQLLQSDVNFNRSMADYPLTATPELIQDELNLLKEVKSYLSTINVKPTDAQAHDVIKAYLQNKGRLYDSPDILAKRLLQKLEKEEMIKFDYKNYLLIMILCYVVYNIPVYMLRIKLLLIDSKKDWEVLNCLTTYSIIGNLPPYRVDYLIDNLIDISTIYSSTFEEFKKALKSKDKQRETTELINSVVNPDIQEILEILVLASEIGVEQTLENIDDLLDLKVKSLEITALKRRQIKSAIVMIPVFIILLLLFNYLMFGMTTLSQNMFMAM
jgi:hypothetical protein